MLPRALKKNSFFAQHLIDNNHDMYSIDDCLKILNVCKKKVECYMINWRNMMFY